MLFRSKSCVPLVEEEVDMYAAPYTEFRHSTRVDAPAEAEDDKSTNTEELDASNN